VTPDQLLPSTNQSENTGAGIVLSDNKYYALYQYAIDFRSVLFSDTICSLFIVMQFITMLNKSIWIDFFLGSVIGSLKMALMFIMIFTLALAGITISTMTLYGDISLDYARSGTAMMHMFYDNVSLDSSYQLNEPIVFTIRLTNMLIYYFLITYMLYAVFISIMHDTYRNIGIEKGDPHAKR
jgi:hypothetical protein